MLLLTSPVLVRARDAGNRLARKAASRTTHDADDRLARTAASHTTRDADDRLARTAASRSAREAGNRLAASRPARDLGSRLAREAWQRWFLDRHAAFWSRELGLPAQLQPRLPGAAKLLAARVAEIVDETADTRTFVLRVGGGWPGHLAGQYVPVEAEIDGVRVRRCYSISSGASRAGTTRIAITVKRVPGGKMSTWLHDHVRRGDTLQIGEPGGDFVVGAGRPLLLVGGGSGMTPIIAIVRDLHARGELRMSSGAARVVVVHAARTDADAIFAADLAAIESRAPGLYVLAHRDEQDGRLDAAALQRLVPDLARREVFVCGPAGLMDMVIDVATAAGAPVHHERFVAAPLVRARDGQPRNQGSPDSQPGNHGALHSQPGKHGSPDSQLRNRAASDSQPANQGAPVLHAIQLRGRRVTVAGTGPLLAELERAGERPAHGCRMGICNSCRCHKASGTVENLVTGAVSSEPDQEIRLCVSVARSDLELAL